jgi:arsenite-transporting ATPase
VPETVGRGVATARSLRDQVKRKADAAKTMLFGPYAPGRGTTDEPFSEVVTDMERVADALRNPELTAFRAVTLPEPMVLRETERLVGRLRETGVPLGPVVVNRVLEDVDEGCARCSAQRERQQEILVEMETTFEGLELRRLPDLTGKETGCAALSTLAERLA